MFWCKRFVTMKMKLKMKIKMKMVKPQSCSVWQMSLSCKKKTHFLRLNSKLCISRVRFVLYNVEQQIKADLLQTLVTTHDSTWFVLTLFSLTLIEYDDKKYNGVVKFLLRHKVTYRHVTHTCDTTDFDIPPRSYRRGSSGRRFVAKIRAKRLLRFPWE